MAEPFKIEITVGENEYTFETTDGKVIAETMDQIISDVKTVFGPDAEAVPETQTAPASPPPPVTPPPAPPTTPA